MVARGHVVPFIAGGLTSQRLCVDSALSAENCRRTNL